MNKKCNVILMNIKLKNISFVCHSTSDVSVYRNRNICLERLTHRKNSFAYIYMTSRKNALLKTYIGIANILLQDEKKNQPTPIPWWSVYGIFSPLVYILTHRQAASAATLFSARDDYNTSVNWTPEQFERPATKLHVSI